jgi:hypothetical protein
MLGSFFGRTSYHKQMDIGARAAAVNLVRQGALTVRNVTGKTTNLDQP